MTLPTAMTTRAERDPLELRMVLAGAPKSGKTTLASGWAPPTTLIVDTQRGTSLLDGSHFVAPVTDWASTVDVIRDLCRPGHPYRTVVIDMIDDVWRWCDIHHAPRGKAAASAANDFQASIRQAELSFYKVFGQLLTTSLGVWFLTHTTTRLIDGDEQEVPKLDKRVYGWVSGACDVIAIAEGHGRKLHTTPTARFQAGSRLQLKSPQPLDARGLYADCKQALIPTTPDGG